MKHLLVAATLMTLSQPSFAAKLCKVHEINSLNQQLPVLMAATWGAAVDNYNKIVLGPERRINIVYSGDGVYGLAEAKSLGLNVKKNSTRNKINSTRNQIVEQHLRTANVDEATIEKFRESGIQALDLNNENVKASFREAVEDFNLKEGRANVFLILDSWDSQTDAENSTITANYTVLDYQSGKKQEKRISVSLNEDETKKVIRKVCRTAAKHPKYLGSEKKCINEFLSSEDYHDEWMHRKGTTMLFALNDKTLSMVCGR